MGTLAFGRGRARGRRNRTAALAAAAALTFGAVFATGAGDVAHADTKGPIGFESGYSLGSVNGQNGWSSFGSYDQAVVATSSFPGAPASFGTRALRISDSTTSGSFGDQTFSTSTVNEAGEPAAQSGGIYSGGTRQPRFHGQFDLAAVTPGAPEMHMSVSPDRGDGARMSYLRIEQNGSGLQVFFDDYQDAAPFGSLATPTDGCDVNDDFIETPIATNLNDAVPHRFAFDMQFVPGPRNDIVKISIDGSVVYTGTSWEDYFRWCAESQPPTPDYASRTVDSLLFRESGTPNAANAGLGYLLDNVIVSTGPTVVNVNSNSLAPAGPWALEPSSNTGSYYFGPGPGTPPSGVGSLSLNIASGQHEWMNNYAYGVCATGPSCNNPNPTPLANFDGLSYSGYRASGTTYPTLNVESFANGPGSYTTFVFVPNNGSIVNSSWQTWDATDPSQGVWYSSRDLTLYGSLFNCGAFSCTASWGQIQAAFPNAVVAYGLGMNVGTGGTFSGAVDNMSVSVSGTNTVYNFEPDGFPKISIPSVTNFLEGNSGAFQPKIVAVTLDHPFYAPVTVSWTTKTGTAGLNTDYQAGSGTVTFAPGQTSQFIGVNVMGDLTPERFENFYVRLSNPSNATLANGQATMSDRFVIQNDDLPKLTSNSTLYVTEGNNAAVTFKLNFPYYQTIVVNVTSANITAVQPGDYLPIPGGTQVTFAPNTTTSSPATVSTLVRADGVVGEPQEKFKITGAPTTPGMANKVVTIIIPTNNT